MRLKNILNFNMRKYLPAQIGEIAKKLTVLAVVLFLGISLSGCGVKQPRPLMDKLSADNNYHYQNTALGFSLVLPPEFLYYQTQKKETNGAVELAIFVPTADVSYPQEVSGYAKPVSLEIYNSSEWDKLSDQEKNKLNKVGVKDSRVYTLLFWQKIPSDWTSKWNEKMKEKIIKGFQTK